MFIDILISVLEREKKQQSDRQKVKLMNDFYSFLVLKTFQMRYLYVNCWFLPVNVKYCHVDDANS